MGMYYCYSCNNLKDGDYDPMEDSEMCPECHQEMLEAKREDIEDGRKEEEISESRALDFD